MQIHRLDRGAPKKEIMRALNDVVEKGWVRYIGASSMAAWEFQELQVKYSPSSSSSSSSSFSAPTFPLLLLLL